MAEEEELDQAAAEPEPITTAPIVGTDGKLSPKWRDTLPEDIRGEKMLEPYKDFSAVVKSLVSAQRMVGKDKIALPNEKSLPSEWDAFYDATGRPKTKDEYKLPVPEDIKEHYDPALIATAKEIFHKVGFNQKQAEALWQFEEQRLRNGIKAIAAAEAAENKETEDALKEKWGEAYPERLLIVNTIISDNAPEELREKLVNEYGNDPVFAEFVHNIGLKFIEHKVIETPLIPTPADLDEQISTLMHTDAYQKREHPDHKRTVDKVLKLHEAKAKSKRG